MKLDDLATRLPLSTDPLDLDAARRDLWPRGTMQLREGRLPPRPLAVVWPEEEEQVLEALDWAQARGLRVVPYGAGSGVCGAAAGQADSLVVDTKRMRRILHLDGEQGRVVAQPGLIGQHLEDELQPLGWMLAHSPSSIMCSTLGGYAAARSAGQFSSRYGVFEDMTRSLHLATPTGLLRAGARTPVGEEDLLPVICGSEGALGVITELELQLAPLPEQRWLRGYAFPDLDSAWAAMRSLMQGGLWPSALRLYDPVDTRIGGPARAARAQGAEKGPSVFARLRKLAQTMPGLSRHLLDIPLSLPRLVNRLAAGLGDEVLMIIGFEGPASVVEVLVEAARPLLAAARDLGPEPGQYWYAHRHDVSYKLAPIFAEGAWADTMEVAAPWSRLAELHRAVRAAISEHAVVMAHFSHAYPEGCSIYFSFAGAGDESIYDACWARALAAARQAGGTVTHHHGVGQLKMEEAAREAGAAVRVWREIKARLDPSGLMNPGRLFPELPLAAGPAAPTGGPVYALDADSGLAEVDPLAPVAAVEAELRARGWALRLRPDRPLAEWLLALPRGRLPRWQVPFFAVQARFEDGVSARIGGSPRSAAGPDLRWSLLRRARPEMVQVPVLRLGEGPWVETGGGSSLEAELWRPAWSEQGRWGFSGPAAVGLALARGGGRREALAPTVDPLHGQEG